MLADHTITGGASAVIRTNNGGFFGMPCCFVHAFLFPKHYNNMYMGAKYTTSLLRTASLADDSVLNTLDINALGVNRNKVITEIEGTTLSIVSSWS